MSRPLIHTPDGDVYEVFAKFQIDEPLHHIGSVIATDRELARMYAYTLYNEWAWNEMVIVPRREIVTLIGPPITMNQTPPQTYHLYGRKAYPQPLAFLGRLEIEDTADLKDAALKLVGENGWVELVAIPEASLIPVIVGGNPA